MKIFAFIMAVIVLTLSTVPCHCCDNCGSPAEKQSQKDHDGCAGNCSPFVTCGTCTGFTTSNFYAFIHAVPSGMTSLKAPVINQRVSSFFWAKIWQPPKLA